MDSSTYDSINLGKHGNVTSQFALGAFGSEMHIKYDSFQHPIEIEALSDIHSIFRISYEANISNRSVKEIWTEYNSYSGESEPLFTITRIFNKSLNQILQESTVTDNGNTISHTIYHYSEGRLDYKVAYGSDTTAQRLQYSDGHLIQTELVSNTVKSIDYVSKSGLIDSTILMEGNRSTSLYYRYH